MRIETAKCLRKPLAVGCVGLWLAFSACGSDDSAAPGSAGTAGGAEASAGAAGTGGATAGSGGGGRAGSGASAGTGATDGGTKSQCLAREVLCTGKCTDISTDTQNCGACGTRCSGNDPCKAGACAGTATCPPGMIECGGCYDVSNDPEFCGSCRPYQCAGSEFCVDGQCSCRPGLTDCGGNCVDTQSDLSHCGGCGRACNQSCVGGNCVSGSSCTQTDCSGACVDTNSNPLHCGACNALCAVDQICIGGQCYDYAATTDCTSCAGCNCAAPEKCCDIGGYGIVCVDTPQPCP